MGARINKKRVLHPKKKKKPVRPALGAPPGTLTEVPELGRPHIRVLCYGPDGIDEHECSEPEQLTQLVGARNVTWIDVDGLGDPAILQRLATALEIHPLVLEDVISVVQQSKVEQYREYQFIVLRMLHYDDAVDTEQLSLYVGKNFVVTFQGGRPGDCLEPVRGRIRAGKGRIRELGADYLAYALIDAVVDGYFPVIEGLGQRLEALEHEVLFEPKPDVPERIQAAKRDLREARRALWPLREGLQLMMKFEDTVITEHTRTYLRDTFDHTDQLVDAVADQRELAGSLMDLYLLSMSHRMNHIMRVLTVISAIFIPLTFIVGVYGMNFDPDSSPWNMPELRWTFGYPVVLLVMIGTAVGMLVYFRRNGWIGRDSM